MVCKKAWTIVGIVGSSLGGRDNGGHEDRAEQST
jgi:hypothetical protein